MTAHATRPPQPETSAVARVADLARVKRLPLKFLQALGLKDIANGVAIEYRLMNGSPAPRLRIRLSPAGEKHLSIWNKHSGAIVPYGLDRLSEAYNSGFIVIVEGESDCWTLWEHAFPALGIPGATMVHTLAPEYFSSEITKVFVVQEPGDAGKSFVEKVAAKLREPAFGWSGDIFIVTLGQIKDPSDLHVKDRAGFNQAFQAALDSAVAVDRAEPPDWRAMFHTHAELTASPGLTFAIDRFLQTQAATFIAGLSGHDKTFVMLSIVKASLTKQKLWGLFDITEPAARCVYLVPESSLGPFAHRLKLFGLMEFTHPSDERLLVRTLSKGPTPCLSDPRIMYAAKGADVYLDTAVRFANEGSSENDASDVSRGLAADIFALLGSGARLVVGAQHSPKSFAKENTMTLENILRGSGDIGAMLATCWGVRLLDEKQNIVYVQNCKPRDFEPCEPFQLIGRPYIDQEGDLRLHKCPGESGWLHELLDLRDKGGGAPKETRDERSKRVEMVRGWLKGSPYASRQDIVHWFAEVGTTITKDTARRYLEDARKTGDQA